jgi:hypothetical protein
MTYHVLGQLVCTSMDHGEHHPYHDSYSLHSTREFPSRHFSPAKSPAGPSVSVTATHCPRPPGHATVPRGTRPVSSSGSQGVLRSQPFGRRQTRTVSSTVSQAVPSPMPQGPGCCNLLRSNTGNHVNRAFFANKNLLEACPRI